MKKNLFLAFFAFCTLQFYAQTQAVKIGPLGFLLGNYNARYEKKLNDKGSFQVGANYFDYELFDLGVTGFGLDAGYRHYFKESIRGGYVSPALGFDFNSTTGLDAVDASYSQLGIGATVGYQWAKESGFLVDLGLGYGVDMILSKSDNLGDGYGGGGLRFTFAIGYAF
jgi:hypothetical protein